MARSKKATSFEPIVGKRERELLDNLALLKSQGKKTTTVAFARNNGYANKSALRHFAGLRRELSEYVAQCSPTPQKQRSSLNVKYLNVQIERQARKIEILKTRVKTIPKLEAKITKLESEKKEGARQKKLLRGMLSTVISFLSGSDFARARDLSERLEKQAKSLMEDDQEDPRSPDKS
jgi:hypothetical protein